MKKRVFTFIVSAGLLLCVCGVRPSRAEVPRVNGRTVKFFPGEAQVHEITWRKNGQVVRRRTYHRNGKLYRDYIYRDAQPTGKKEYHLNGRLKYRWTARTQEGRRYDQDGVLERRIKTGLARKNR